MNKQPEALRLAEWLERGNRRSGDAAIANELRRLHAENQALNDALQYSMGCHREMSKLAVRQRARLDELEEKLKSSNHKMKSLNTRQIQDIVISVCDKIYPQDDSSYSEADSVFYGAFVRAVEEAYGIK